MSRAALVWRRIGRDRIAIAAALILLALVLAALLAPWLAPYDPYKTALLTRMQDPSAAHWLGTDEQGRDILSRILFGLRLTLLTGLVSVATGGVTGAALGILAAYYERLDGPIMRAMDVLFSYPAILFGLAIAGVYGPGPAGIIAALAIATIPPTARIARGSAAILIRQDFITAGRALGLGDGALIGRYVTLNCVPSIAVYMTLRFGQAILLGASLSFLGLGARPPAAELGTMASQGRSLLFIAPHVSVIPSVTIFILVLSLNVLGDAVRDILDPRIRS